MLLGGGGSGDKGEGDGGIFIFIAEIDTGDVSLFIPGFMMVRGYEGEEREGDGAGIFRTWSPLLNPAQKYFWAQVIGPILPGKRPINNLHVKQDPFFIKTPSKLIRTQQNKTC